MGGSNPPRDVCDLGQTVIRAGSTPPSGALDDYGSLAVCSPCERAGAPDRGPQYEQHPSGRPSDSRGEVVAGLSGTGRPADDLYLMAHHEVSGKPSVQPRALGLGLAGGLLAELMLGGNVRLVPAGAVVEAGRPPPEDGLARSVLGLVAGERERRPVRDWLLFVARTAAGELGRRLEQSGYVTQAGGRRLWRSGRWVPVDADWAFAPLLRVRSALDATRPLSAQGRCWPPAVFTAPTAAPLRELLENGYDPATLAAVNRDYGDQWPVEHIDPGTAWVALSHGDGGLIQVVAANDLESLRCSLGRSPDEVTGERRTSISLGPDSYRQASKARVQPWATASRGACVLPSPGLGRASGAGLALRPPGR